MGPPCPWSLHIGWKSEPVFTPSSLSYPHSTICSPGLFCGYLLFSLAKVSSASSPAQVGYPEVLAAREPLLSWKKHPERNPHCALFK